MHNQLIYLLIEIQMKYEYNSEYSLMEVFLDECKEKEQEQRLIAQLFIFHKQNIFSSD